MDVARQLAWWIRLDLPLVVVIVVPVIVVVIVFFFFDSATVFGISFVAFLFVALKAGSLEVVCVIGTATRQRSLVVYSKVVPI